MNLSAWDEFFQRALKELEMEDVIVKADCLAVTFEYQGVSDRIPWELIVDKHFAAVFKRLEAIKAKAVHWTKHPVKSVDLQYDADGKPTSPWFREAKIEKDDLLPPPHTAPGPALANAPTMSSSD